MSLEERKADATIVIAADTSQAKAGLDGIKDAGKGMATSVAQSAKQASDAIDGMGQTSERAAVTFTKSEGQFAASIKRSTFELQNLGKTLSQKFEAKLELRGLDKAKFEPQLAELRRVEAAALQAATGLDKMGMSARATSAALRGVPAQFTDIITSLQGGQAPLTVLLQQGGQLKDVFGGIGPAVQALGGYIKGLVTPLSVAAVGVAAIGIAAYKASEDVKALGAALVLTGNRSGTTSQGLQDIAKALASSGAGSGAATAALVEFVNAGVKADDSLGKFVRTAIDLERLGGPAVEKTAKAFADLAKDPLTATLKLNESINFVTTSLYDQIKALELQGDKIGAAALAQKAFSEAQENIKAGLLALEGPLDVAARKWGEWGRAAVDATKKAASAIANVGAPPTGSEQNARDRAELALFIPRDQRRANDRYIGPTDAEAKALQERVAYYDAVTTAANKAAEARKRESEIVNLKAQFDAQDEATRKQAKLNQGIADYGKLLEAGQITVAQYAAAINRLSEEKEKAAKTPKITDDIKGLAVYNDLVSKSVGYNADYAEKVGLLAAAFAKGRVNLEGLQAAIKQLNSEQQFAKDEAKAWEEQTKAINRTIADSVKEYDKLVDGYARAADAAVKQVQKLEDEEAALIIAAAQNISLAQAIEEVVLARLREKQVAELSGGNQEAADAIKAEIVAREKLIGLIGNKEARDITKKAAEDAAKEWKRTADQLENIISDGLMRGFENGKGFAENFRDTLQNVFKTMVLRPVIQAAVQPITGAIQNSIGGATGTAALTQTLPLLAALAAGQAIGAKIAGDRKLFGMSGGELSSIFGISGGVAARLFGKGEYVTGTSVNASFDATGQRTARSVREGFNINDGGADGDAVVQGIVGSYLAAANRLGIKAQAANVAFETNNFDGGRFGLSASVGGKNVLTVGETKYTEEALKLTASRAVLAALQASELPAMLSKAFDGIVADSASQQQIDSALQFAESLKAIRFGLLSATEQQAEYQKIIDASTASLGTSAATFKTDFIKAIDAGLTQEGLAQWSALGGTMQALEQITGKAATGVEEVTRSLKDIANERKGLQDTLDSLTLNNAQLLEKQRTALDESNRGLFDQVQAAQSAKDAADALAQAQADQAQAAADAAAALASTNAGLQDRLDVLTGAQTERSLQLRDATDASTKALLAQIFAQENLSAAQAAAAQAAKETSDALAQAINTATSAQQSAIQKYTAPLDAQTAGAALGQNAVDSIAGKTAEQIRELARVYVTSLDAQTVAGRAAIEQFDKLTPAIDFFASAADQAAQGIAAAAQKIADERKGLEQQLFDLTASQAEKAARARAAIAPENLDVYDKVIAAQQAVKTATDGATAAAAAFAAQMERFGSNFNLRFDLAGLDNVSNSYNAESSAAGQQAFINAARQNIINALGMDALDGIDFDQLLQRRNADLAVVAIDRLKAFFTSIGTAAASLEDEIASSGSKVGQGVQAAKLAGYFTGFGDDLNALFADITSALANSVATLSATDVDELVASVGGGASKIGAAITRSILASVGDTITANAAFGGLDTSTQAYLAAVVGGVGKDDVQGINDAFLLLNGSLTTGRLTAAQYDEAINLVTAAFEGSIAAAVDAASAAKEYASLLDRLAIATGSKTGQQVQRANELAAALNDQNRATLNAIYAAEDLAAAREKEIQAAKDGVTAAFAGVQRAIDAQRGIAQAQLDVANDSVNNLTNIFDTIKGGVETLRDTAESLTQYTTDSAVGFISNALKNAQATGYLPDADQLADAVSAAVKGVTGQVFATQADAEFAKLSLAGTLTQLQDITGVQLTTAEQAVKFAEQQLATLDATLENAQAQLDALNGVDTSVKSVADAMAALTAAITGQQRLTGGNSGVGTVSGTSGNTTVGTFAGQTFTQNNSAFGGIGLAAELEAIRVAQQIGESPALALYKATYNKGSSTELWNKVLSESGYADTLSVPGVREFLREQGVPGFAVGTNYVPADMLAVVHKGEAIVPAAYNPANGGSGSSRTDALIEGLTAEVKRLQEFIAITNANTRRTADAVNGNPDAPILVTTV